MEDFIGVYDNALSNDLCRYIVDRFEVDSKYHYLGMISSFSAEVVDDENKKTTELCVSDHEEWSDIDSLLYENLGHYFKRYTLSLGDLFTCGANEIGDQAYRIKKYDVGDGFNWHIDVSSKGSSGRWIAAQWYFNTVYQGGETEFMNSGKTIRPVTGRLVFFPSTWTYMHRSVPVYSGPKYICTTFFSPRWD